MFGTFLIGFLVVGLVSLLIWGILKLRDSWYDNPTLPIIFIVSGIISVIMLITIQPSRMDSRQNIEYIRVFKETLKVHRTDDEMSSFERFQVMEEINHVNGRIATWKTKGQKWYYNDWLYVDETNDVEYIR